MKKTLSFISVIIFLVSITLIHFVTPTYSDELDDINKQLNDLTSALNMSINATKPLESQLTDMQKQIADIRGRVTFIENDVAAKKKNIAASYADISQKTDILDAKIRDYYIKSAYDNPLLLLMSTSDASTFTQVMAYQRATADQDKAVITNIVLSISDLETRKAALESEETRLVAAKASLDAQSAKLDTIVQGAKAYQASLNNQIAALSAKQQALLQAKYDSLGIPLSAYNQTGGCSSDLTNGKDPGFSPKFGMFTYGVNNRVGLNQYGAKGRAEAGQSYTDILHAYYNADITTGYDTGITVNVTGSNEYGENLNTNWNIEDYVKHIYEMPASWPAEALKAQAIAARSYALAYTNNGSGSICATQSCQVVKTELNDSAWQAAVDATKGIVLTSGGSRNPIKAWFSSTHGGYVYTSADIGWSSTPYTKRGQDTTGDVSNFSDLQSKAYDRNSPWFYCDWGSRSQYGGTAWLQSSELADIVNVILLARADGGTTSHLTQTDKSNPDGADTWDAGRVRQELQSRGGSPYSSIDSISVSADFGVGRTSSVTISGDAGSQTIAGDFFKQFFNLRAPANIQIVGPLYNIEKR